jgi:hypothetical protein
MLAKKYLRDATNYLCLQKSTLGTLQTIYVCKKVVNNCTLGALQNIHVSRKVVNNCTLGGATKYLCF